MFSRIRGFLSRHRRKFIIGSVVVSGAIFLTRYTQRKLREWQENEIRALLERTKKQQYYENMLKTCNQMILSLVATLRNSVIEENDSEFIINQLKDGSVDKISAWNQLKVLAITRSAVIIYSYTMLVTFLRIQLSLISGHMYKGAQNVDNESIENEIQRKYMALSSYFIYEGIINLNSFVKSKVAEATAAVSLTERLTLRDLEQIYWAIASSVSADGSGDPIKNCTHYMLQKNGNDEEKIAYSKLIDQLLDMLESEEVQDLMQKNVRSGFVLLMDHISTYFNDSSQSDNGCTTRNGMLQSSVENSLVATDTGSTEFVNINKTSIALARIIPIVNKQIPDNPTHTDAAAGWLQYLVLNNELKTLGANIYEAVSYVHN
ncbi:hypothetical protein DMN91_002134 [Ooceraea biroi]|uniref:Peroxisomal biogenesis factor 3 n=1 Tax=Ooceraea biroi TaxID=2015173 RepID=A0A026W9D6_OOCBI|nr:peroxisomal biogenesis factor 3 [Ooceraea biroi]EZA52717.1 Peroxisomal biogenesis factor [Ooceraea biroi]RLU25971.1 hypothetical protein DMN91_002134 [Ooceraea biroi]